MMECLLYLLRPLGGPMKDVWAIAETSVPYGYSAPSLLDALGLGRIFS